MLEEVWKKFHNIEVSSHGHVKNNNFTDGTWGGTSNNGYKVVSTDVGKMLKVHRIVAHLFIDMPLDDPRQVDHINGIRDDNRVENLRIVSNRENQQNLKIHRNGRLVGVYFKKSHGKWSSSISLNGKIRFIGLFETELEGHNAYVAALESYDKQGVLPAVASKANRLNKINPKSKHLYGATFKGNRWVSQIVLSGKKIYLGAFKTELEAHLAYISKLN